MTLGPIKKVNQVVVPKRNRSDKILKILLRLKIKICRPPAPDPGGAPDSETESSPRNQTRDKYPLGKANGKTAGEVDGQVNVPVDVKPVLQKKLEGLDAWVVETSFVRHEDERDGEFKRRAGAAWMNSKPAQGDGKPVDQEKPEVSAAMVKETMTAQKKGASVTRHKNEPLEVFEKRKAALAAKPPCDRCGGAGCQWCPQA